MGDPRDVRKQRLEEDLVSLDVRYRDVDGQIDCPCAFETQRDQSLPSTAHRCPIPGTGSDGLAPVTADVSQGDDRSGIGMGDEGGAQRDHLGRKAVHRLQ